MIMKATHHFTKNHIITKYHLFQPLSYDVLVCKIYAKNQSNAKWRISDKIKLKYNLADSINDFEVIIWTMNEFVVCFQVLFVFHLKQNFIECVDLLNPEYGSYKHDMFDNIDFEHVIKDNNGYIHLLNIKTEYGYRSSHSKVALLHLLPNVILNRIMTRYKLLIDGFCRLFQEKLSCLIPTDIIELILNNIDIKDSFDLN